MGSKMRLAATFGGQKVQFKKNKLGVRLRLLWLLEGGIGCC